MENHVPAGIKITQQSENGMLGIGPFSYDEDVDPDLINASKQTISALPTTSFFSSADSFGMIRGGHIGMAVQGAMEVSADGYLANCTLPGKMVKDHVSKHGDPKIVPACTLPLTGKRVVDMIVSDLVVFAIDRKAGGLTLVELAPGVTLEEVTAKTGAPFVSALEEAL